MAVEKIEATYNTFFMISYQNKLTWNNGRISRFLWKQYILNPITKLNYEFTKAITPNPKHTNKPSTLNSTFFHKFLAHANRPA